MHLVDRGRNSGKWARVVADASGPVGRLMKADVVETVTTRQQGRNNQQQENPRLHWNPSTHFRA